MYLLLGWDEGEGLASGEEGGGKGGSAFSLFVTPLKMYMGITSKLVNRKEKHPLAIFFEESAT